MSDDLFRSGLTRRAFVKRAVGGLAVAAGGLGALAACGGGGDSTDPAADTAADTDTPAAATTSAATTSASSSGGTFKLGAIPPLTGFAAADGIEQKQAQMLAIEEWNAKGGVLGMKIEPTFLDLGDMEPANMVTLLRQLVDKYKVDAIVTGYTVYSGVEYDLMAQAGIPYLNVNTSEDDATIVRGDPEKYWNIWQYDPSNKWYGIGFPTFVNGIVDSGAFTPRNQEIAIVYASDGYDTTIAKQCQQAMTDIGWTVSIFEQVTSPINEWGPVLQKLRNDDPDIIFLASLVLGDQVSFAQQFAQSPTKSLVYGQYIPSLKEYKEQAGEAAEGVVWSTVVGPIPTPEGEAFKSAYQARWNTPAGSSIGGVLYDGVNLYLSAVEKAGTKDDYRAILDVMTSMNYVGACGTYAFDKSDHTTWIYPEQVDSIDKGIPHLYQQIQDGTDQIVVPEPVTTAAFKLPPWF